jgi:hypothetical protein
MYALAYPEPTPGKRTDLSNNCLGEKTPHPMVLSQARVIVKWAPDCT